MRGENQDRVGSPIHSPIPASPPPQWPSDLARTKRFSLSSGSGDVYGDRLELGFETSLGRARGRDLLLCISLSQCALEFLLVILCRLGAIKGLS
jgi:hypothetical protein